MSPPATSGVHIAVSVFAGLCLFAALCSFVTGWGQIGAGQNRVHTQQAEADGKMRTGDPIDNNYNREIADSNDREETAHGEFNLVVGAVLLIPAALLWRKSAGRKNCVNLHDRMR